MLDASIEEVSWFGRGPGEAYRDTHSATRVGRFSAPVDSLATPYVRPQENGNRMQARRLSLLDDTGQILGVTGYPHVDFTARRWSPEQLTAARHRLTWCQTAAATFTSTPPTTAPAVLHAGRQCCPATPSWRTPSLTPSGSPPKRPG